MGSTVSQNFAVEVDKSSQSELWEHKVTRLLQLFQWEQKYKL